MRLPAVREIKEHGVVEHRAVTLGHALEAFDDAINDLHVMRARAFADGFRRKTADAFVVAHIVHVHLFALDTRNAGVTVTEFVHGEGDHIGQTGNQCAEQHLRVTDLAVQRGDVRIEIFRIELGHVLADDLRHRVDLAIALADGFHGVRIILHLGLFNPSQRVGNGTFVVGNKLEHLAI